MQEWGDFNNMAEEILFYKSKEVNKLLCDTQVMKQTQTGLRETEEFTSLQKFEENERWDFCGDNYFVGCLDALPMLGHPATLAMKNTDNNVQTSNILLPVQLIRSYYSFI